MTCNPEWPEIKNALLPGETTNDRPDLVARTWNQYLRSLLLDLRTCFGRAVGMMWSNEWQKRGLPHAHILVILAPVCGTTIPRRQHHMSCVWISPQVSIHSVTFRHALTHCYTFHTLWHVSTLWRVCPCGNTFHMLIFVLHCLHMRFYCIGYTGRQVTQHLRL